jgi:hypothetical protein
MKPVPQKVFIKNSNFFNYVLELEKVLSEDSKLSVRGQLDHFEKWLGICKLPKNTNNSHNAMRPVMNEQDICKEVKDSVESFDDYEPKAKKQRQCLGKIQCEHT